MSDLLSVSHLSITLKQTHQPLVRDLSFCVSGGQSLILLGQSGSGKTMTCRAVMSLLDRRKFRVDGSIRFDGRELLSLPAKEKRQLYGGAIAFIPQNPMTAFDPSMRIGKQMTETLALHQKLPQKMLLEKAEQALVHAGLSDPEKILRSYPHTLSGGMLQRVTIAMALMGEAKLLVADEPTTALDVVHRNETIEAFSSLRAQGTAIFMVTHDFAAAAQLGGEVMIMKDGTILEKGAVNEVRRQPRNAYTKALIAASVLRRADAGKGEC